MFLGLVLVVLAVESVSTVVVSDLIEQGIIGVVVVLFVFGYLYAKPSVEKRDREFSEQLELQIKDKIAAQEAAEKARREFSEYRDRVEQDTIPTLVRVTEIMAEVVDLVETRSHHD